MTTKLTERFYADHDSIETVRFYRKGDTWYHPNTSELNKTFEESTFDASFKRRTGIRLVGAEAEEAWANWNAHVDSKK
jgi:hypothetical protein